MGQRLVAAVAAGGDTQLVGATERSGHAALGKDAGLVAGAGELKVMIQEDLAGLLKSTKAEVVIDFTAPQATLKHAELCAQARAAMVIGTTGLSAEERARLKDIAKTIPVLLAPNMSVGVNLMFHLCRIAAQVLGDGFDIEVIEAHHRLKKDAPSGTAVRLGEILAEARGWKFKEVERTHREGMIGERPNQEIGMQTIRGGDIVGEHTVLFAGIGERLEIIHRATSRDTLARGAVRAARWVVKQPAGLYSMQDLLGLT
jgi:4-hydroxy-tetrahydrodipicolinate reductase